MEEGPKRYRIGYLSIYPQPNKPCGAVDELDPSDSIQALIDDWSAHGWEEETSELLRSLIYIFDEEMGRVVVTGTYSPSIMPGAAPVLAWTNHLDGTEICYAREDTETSYQPVQVSHQVLSPF